MSEHRALTVAALVFMALDMTPLRLLSVWRRSPIRRGALEAGDCSGTLTRRN
jgi:hypothetical protein